MIPKPEPKQKTPKPLTRKTTLQAKTGFKPVTKIKLKKTKLKQSGKVTKRWSARRKQWLLDNRPDEQGNYVCGICGGKVHMLEVTLDHIKPRSRRPDLRYIEENLQPAHFLCNQQKGST